MSDPGDDRIARLSLLDRLDRPPGYDPARAFDPAYRTIDGRSLDEDESDLLLSCTEDDLRDLAELLNAEAEQLEALNRVAEELNDLVRPYSEGDGHEATFSRMPTDLRRQARRLFNLLAAERYWERAGGRL